MGLSIDEQRLRALRAAIAPRQEGDTSAVADEHPRQRQRGWGLARPAHSEIADTNRRGAGPLAGRPHALRGRSSVRPAGRLEQAGKQGWSWFAPETRGLHRPAPVDGNRALSAPIERSTAPARRSTRSPAARAMARSRVALANKEISASPKSSGRPTANAPPVSSSAA